MLNRFLALSPAILVLAYGLWIGPAYDRYVLPAFDGHAYAAMAESPRFFTLAPWGYRIIEPWLVSLLPASSAAAGFYWLNLLLLAGAMLATSRWLLRLGFSRAAAALASSAFALSPPVRILLDYQVLVDPLALLLLILLLEEVLRPDLLVLTALLAVAGLTKETGLLWITIIPLYLVHRERWARGLLDSAAVAAPAVALALLLRVTWGSPDPPPYSFPVLDVTLGRVLTSGWALVSAAMLSGLFFPAFVGMFREASIPLRAQAAILWIFTFGLILANPYLYSVADLPRLSLLAWPALLPLALSGLGFRRTPAPPPPLSPGRERLRTAAAGLSLLLCLVGVAVTDPYQRAPFVRPHDPIVLTGRVRETLKTAAALEAGETFTFDARSGRFAAPIKETFNLTEARRHRWFLLDGFGPGAVFGSGSPSFEGEALLLLPVFVPRVVTMSMELEGPDEAEVTVRVAGRNIAAVHAGKRSTFSIPANSLFRGDNILRLRGPRGVSLRLLRFDARLESAAAGRK
jgi:hypothetical protein